MTSEERELKIQAMTKAIMCPRCKESANKPCVRLTGEVVFGGINSGETAGKTTEERIVHHKERRELATRYVDEGYEP